MKNVAIFLSIFLSIFVLFSCKQKNKKIDSLLPLKSPEEKLDRPEEKIIILRNQTKLILPVKSEWNVLAGGYDKNNNDENIRQVYSIDLKIIDSNGKSYKNDGTTNEDYYAFDKPIIAPCDGKVKSVLEGISDNIPGEINTEQPYGNAVVLETSNGEYILLAHLKLNSITLKFDDSVNKGQLLGRCGNSGNSTEPYLHFFIQPKIKKEGAKGYKCFFENLLVNDELKADYSPKKGDRIKNSLIE